MGWISKGNYENTKRNANLIYLVDRVDALRVQLGDATEQERHSIFAMIEKYSGSMFAPELVEAFLVCSSADSFWFYMDQEANERIFRYLDAKKDFPMNTLLNF